MNFRQFRLYPQFRGNAEKSPFLVFLAPAPRQYKISRNCLLCLKDNCPGFQQTPSEIMPGVYLPIFFMPKLKSFGVAPTSPTGFTAAELRRTTSSCYHFGYSWVLVNRVYQPKCEETSLEISPMLRHRDLFFGQLSILKYNAFSTRNLMVFWLILWWISMTGN